MASTSTLIPVLECSGTPLDIGRAHGEAGRDLIAMGMDRWRAKLREKRGDAGDYITGFLARTAFVPAIERHTPALLEELHGIADGSGQPFEHVVAYNLMDEEWSFRTDKLGDLAPGCTAVAISGTAIGQTMDIPTVHDGTQIVLAIESERGPSKRVFTAAGMLALNGANNAGVGVVVNNLAELPSSAHGLPVTCMVRGILEHESVPAAAAWVESMPHAIGQHYLIGDAQEVIGLEGAANAVYRTEMTGRYVHANHPVTAHASADMRGLEELANTHDRAARAEELIRGATEQADLERILEDTVTPISREPRDGFMTFGGTSIGLTVPPRMRVTSGPPHQSQWIDVSWT
jgi:isopenicillin-N N-acyltransferase like protein